MLSYAHDCQGPDSAVTLSLQALILWFVNVILKLNIQMHTATADNTAQIVNAVCGGWGGPKKPDLIMGLDNHYQDN